jgi:hypothetical protein
LKRLSLISIIVAVLLIGWLVLNLVHSPEPSYQGRKLSEWISEYQEAEWNHQKYPDSSATKQTARQAVKAIGSNAVPVLLQWLQAKTPPLKTSLNNILKKQKFTSFRFETVTRRNILAISGFEILGSDALPALPAFTRMAQSPEKRQRLEAMLCLPFLDDHRKNILPTLLQLLKSPDKEVQISVAIYLAENYPEDAGKAGVYQMYPRFKPVDDALVPTNSPH